MACRQLGYLGGHLHMTHGNSSIGDLRAALAAGDAAAAMEFDCAGEERTLGSCQWRNRSVAVFAQWKLDGRKVCCDFSKYTV